MQRQKAIFRFHYSFKPPKPPRLSALSLCLCGRNQPNTGGYNNVTAVIAAQPIMVSLNNQQQQTQRKTNVSFQVWRLETRRNQDNSNKFHPLMTTRQSTR